MPDPLPEAYDLVGDDHITERNFRDFVFENAVRLWGTQNSRFLRRVNGLVSGAPSTRRARPA